MVPQMIRPLASIFAALLFASIATAEEREFDPSSFRWNPALSPSGPVVVTVDLSSQTAAVYRGGMEIGSCLVSTGRQGYETPTGVFHILEKDADHHSSTYNNASMPYTERLTWGGVALHAGGLPGYPSSHGCVHLPLEFAKRLFSITDVGGTVIITKDGPSVAVSGGHRIEFASYDPAEFSWTPHDSPQGPVSILYSEKDKRLLIIRNGVVIGNGEAHLGMLAPKPKGTYAYLFDGWLRGGQDEDPFAHWHQVSGPANSHEIKAMKQLKTDPRLKHVLDAVLVPGTLLVITDESVSDATRSQPGFNILGVQTTSL